MGEERIKSEKELNGGKEELSIEELEEVAGGAAFHESATKSSSEQDEK